MLFYYLLTTLAVAQTPCSWETPQLGAGWIKVEVPTVDGAGSLAVTVAGSRVGPRVAAQLDGAGPLRLALEDETVVVRATLVPGEAALYPTEAVSLGSGVTVLPSGTLQVVSLAPQGVRVGTTIPGFIPAQPLEAVLSCEALSLTRGAFPAPDEVPRRDLAAGSYELLAAPGGAVLGTLTCDGVVDCPGAWVLEERDGLAHVELRSGGARMDGWLPAAALARGGGVIGGLLGGQRGDEVRRAACGAQTLWVVDSTGRLAELGQLQPGAAVDVGPSAAEYSAVSLPDATWLSAWPNRLLLRTDDARTCEPVGLVGRAANPPAAGDPIILGALPKEALDAEIKEHLGDIRRCYRDQLAEIPGLTGRVTVKFVIDAGGRVSKAEIKSTSLKNDAVEACMIKEFGTMRFPKPEGGGIVIASYPFNFTPG